jgi:nucleotide-binding universal stress UspA family protein
MKTLLVPTDFTPQSDKSLYFATRLAVALNLKLIIVNAVYSPIKKGEMITRFKKFLTDEAEYELRQLKKSLLKEFPKLDIETFVLTGETATVIVYCARNSGVDLIVMGDKIESELERMFEGDTVKNVIKRSPCAVFVIPDCLGKEEMEEIIFVSEKDQPEKKALTLLSSIARSVQSGLTLVTEQEGKLTGCSLSAELIDRIKSEDEFLELINVSLPEDQIYISPNKRKSISRVTKKASLLERIFNRNSPEKLLFPTPLPKVIFPQFS